MPHTNKRTRALDYQESTGYINLQNGHVNNADASDPVKRTSLKNQIRSVQHLLRRKDLTEDRKAALMERFQVLESWKDARVSKTYERTLALKYHKVKFFERRKAERKWAKLRKQMKMDSNPSDELLIKLKAAEEDLLYVTYFPKSEKYISLYGKRSGDSGSAYTEVTRKRQLRCREQALQAAANAADNGEVLPTDVAASLKSDGRDDASQLRRIPQYPLEADDSSLCGAEDNVNIDTTNNECHSNDDNPTTTQQEVLEINSSSDEEEDESCINPPDAKEDTESNGQEDGNITAACVTKEHDSKSSSKEYSSDESSSTSSSSIQTCSLEDDESLRKSGVKDNIAKYNELEPVSGNRWEGNMNKNERLKDDGGGATRKTSTITRQLENNEKLPSYVAPDDFFVEEEKDCGVVNEQVEEISRKNPKQQWGKKTKHDSLGKYSGRIVDRYQGRRVFHSKGHHHAAYSSGQGGRGTNQKGKKWQSFRKKS